MLRIFENFGQKVAALFNEKMHFGVDHTTKEVHASYDYAALQTLFHYEIYDDENHMFINKGSQGFILEVTPLTGSNEEMENILASLLTDALPDDTDFQFMLMASDKVGHILDDFEESRSSGTYHPEVFKWLAKKRTDFLKQGVYESLTSSGSLVVRNFRLFISVSMPKKKYENFTEDLIELREDLVSSLKSINVFSRNLPIDEFLNVMSDLINPTNDVYPTQRNWREHESLAQQITDPELHIQVQKKQLEFFCKNHTHLGRVYTVKNFPKQAALWKMNDSIGQLFNSSLQIACPFVSFMSIRAISKEKANLNMSYKKMNKEKAAKSPLAKIMPQVTKEYEDFCFLEKRIGEGDRTVKVYYHVFLYSDPKHVNNNERKLRDLYRANGWVLKRDSFLQLPTWLAMFPMMMSEGLYEDLDYYGRHKTITAFNAVTLSPIQAEWKGTSSMLTLLLGRRGQLSGFNPFESDGNFNVAISAAPGRGKSMFTQEYITAVLGRGGKVWVIDAGRSYEKTCKLLGGKFIEFSEESTICLNPFTFITNFESESLPMLKPLFAAMARPTTQVSDEEMAYLEMAIKAAWEEKQNEASVSNVAEWLKKHSDRRCHDLSHLLYSFTKEGMYGKYFEGKATINLNDAFVVLELQELTKNKPLRDVVLWVLMYQISEAMYTGDRSIYKSCIIDEAWDLLGGENAGAKVFIERGFRTARKFTGNFITITQSVNDYYKNEESRAAFECSEFKLILGQSSQVVDQLRENKRLDIDPYTERLLKSLRTTDEYSECVIMSTLGTSVHRIVFDDFSKILFSSKGTEYDAVKNLTAQGYSLQEAIEQIVKQKNITHRRKNRTVYDEVKPYVEQGYSWKDLTDAVFAEKLKPLYKQIQTYVARGYSWEEASNQAFHEQFEHNKSQK